MIKYKVRATHGRGIIGNLRPFVGNQIIQIEVRFNGGHTIPEILCLLSITKCNYVKIYNWILEEFLLQS